MRIYIIFACLLALAQSPVMSGLKHKIERDEYLVVPGVGAENVLLGQGIKGLHESYSGNSRRISKPSKVSDLFKDVYRISGLKKVYFDLIFYYDDRGVALFVKDGVVRAIAGLSNRRVTIDSIDMTDGIENFIAGYGKKGLTVKRSGKNSACLYLERGIAVFDDNSDGIIDLYLVFRPLQ